MSRNWRRKKADRQARKAVTDALAAVQQELTAAAGNPELVAQLSLRLSTLLGRLDRLDRGEEPEPEEPREKTLAELEAESYVTPPGPGIVAELNRRGLRVDPDGTYRGIEPKKPVFPPQAPISSRTVAPGRAATPPVDPEPEEISLEAPAPEPPEELPPDVPGQWHWAQTAAGTLERVYVPDEATYEIGITGPPDRPTGCFGPPVGQTATSITEWSEETGDVALDPESGRPVTEVTKEQQQEAERVEVARQLELLRKGNRW